MRILWASALISSALVLSGCTAVPVMTSTSTQPNQAQGTALHGRVHGGQNPISGASVYLYAVGTGGYGGKGIAAASSNASTSLLNSNVLTQTPAGGEDSSNNYYVTTDGSGNFSITNDYTCPSAGTQVYLFAEGGNAGAGANSAIGLLAGLGSCGSLSSSTFVVVNEVSTIATAWALAGFATDATHISSSGSTLALQGMANAFAAIANMETLSTGVALTTTPSGNGKVPQSKINTLANILASCVNQGPRDSYCDLLTAQSANGVPVPAETASGAIDIAQFPGSQVSTILQFQLANPPFQPTITSTNDFTIGISYSGPFYDPGPVAVDSSNNVWTTVLANGSGADSAIELYAASYSGAGGGSTWGTSSPITGGGLTGGEAYSIAIDPSGNVWMAWSSGDGLVELSSTGTPLSPYTGLLDGPYLPYAVAADGSGNIWSGNATALYEYIPGTGWANASGFSGGGVDNPIGVAVSASGNIWLSNSPGTLGEFNLSGVANAGSPFSESGSGWTGTPPSSDGQGLAIDASGNIWVPSYGAIAEFNSSGATLSGSTGHTGGGLDAAGDGIAIDGAGNVWVPSVNYGRISEFNSAGNPLSPSSGYVPVNGFSNPYQVAIDGSGNVWTGDSGLGVLVEIVGAATPVVTPLAANLKAPYGSHAVNMP